MIDNGLSAMFASGKCRLPWQGCRIFLAAWLAATLFTLNALTMAADSHADAVSTEITFWTTEVEPDRIATITYLLRAFEATQPGVHVKLRIVAEEDLLDEARLGATLKELGDLIQGDRDTLRTLAFEGFLDKTAAAAAIGRLGANTFSASTLQAMEIDGQLVAVPIHAWIQAIFYHADKFIAAGLPPPNTRERVLSAAQYFYAPLSGRYGIGLGSDASIYTAQTFAQFSQPTSSLLMASDGDGLNFIQHNLADAIGFYDNLAHHAPRDRKPAELKRMFLRGDLAMIVYSSFLLADVALDAGSGRDITQGSVDLIDRVGVAFSTGNTDAAPFGVLEGIGFSRFSDKAKKQAAAALVDFLFTDPAYMTWLHMAPGGMLPVRPHITQSDLFYRDLIGVYRRYGRARIGPIVRMAGEIDVGVLETFIGGRPGTDAQSILSQTIARVLAGELDANAGAAYVISNLKHHH